MEMTGFLIKLSRVILPSKKLTEKLTCFSENNMISFITDFFEKTNRGTDLIKGSLRYLLVLRTLLLKN
jgi:hypothetical protein